MTDKDWRPIYEISSLIEKKDLQKGGATRKDFSWI
jgi:hypothetical protein